VTDTGVDDDYASVPAFMIRARGRTFYTNSAYRWRRHYKLCKRRRIPGVWYAWFHNPHAAPQYWPRMRVLTKQWVPNH
jgi:hypothetical protein